MTVLNILLIEDDQQSLELLVESLPAEIEGCKIRWEPCGAFKDAFQMIADRRFDVVVTDVYRDREGKAKSPVTGDAQGKGVFQEIRGRRFCPVLLFTDGAFPEYPVEGPFVKKADKSPGNSIIVEKLTELIQTGIPEVAHRLHDELDSTSGSYLWDFLDANWDALESGGLTQPEVLDRLIHRRAAVQLGRLETSADGPIERPTIEGAEFYLRPQIARDMRLGHILEREGQYRVVLTPHCHLIVQPGQDRPRADFILTAKTVPAADLFEQIPLKGNAAKRLEELRRRIQSPSDLGKPRGRYWFLPGFLGMPHLFVDFLQLESLEYGTVAKEDSAEANEVDWRSFAVLDAPFAEALQSCFVSFYSAVGLPMLDPERFAALDSPASVPPT